MQGANEGEQSTFNRSQIHPLPSSPADNKSLSSILSLPCVKRPFVTFRKRDHDGIQFTVKPAIEATNDRFPSLDASRATFHVTDLFKKGAGGKKRCARVRDKSGNCRLPFPSKVNRAAIVQEKAVRTGRQRRWMDGWIKVTTNFSSTLARKLHSPPSGSGAQYLSGAVSRAISFVLEPITGLGRL